MTCHFRAFALLSLAAGPLFLAACHDDDAGTVAPSTGSITGQVVPATAVVSVTATPASGVALTDTLTRNRTTNLATYTFNGLSAGTYTLSYRVAAGYVAVPDQPATVTAGNATSLPLLRPVTVAGRLFFTLNDVPAILSTTTGSYQARNLTISGRNTTTAGLTLGAVNVGGPGTFPISSGTYYAGSEAYIIDAGTLQLTSLDLTSRRASGTFTATAASPFGAGTATITKGSFTDIVLR